MDNSGWKPPARSILIERAKQILHNLEQGELNEVGQPRLAQGNGVHSGQLGLFGSGEQRSHERLRDELSAIDVDRLTPLEALTRLHALVELVRKGGES